MEDFNNPGVKKLEAVVYEQRLAGKLAISHLISVLERLVELSHDHLSYDEDLLLKAELESAKQAVAHE